MILYSRNDCPLCEDVEETLQKLFINYRFVDIDLDEELRKQYHSKIPVLENENLQKLFFPFSENELIDFSKS